ncbi:YbaN family protein [Amphibacillus sp. Q70]|uniref:YbaN family protein n=1 Tax=Amphibacillus sp. Q70 TaxID=3453416 RepID=UPI003F874E59
MKNIKSIFFIIPGFISFGIGVAGVVLPVLPGLPFFLVSSYCFAKSSKRVENWFKQTKLYKKYVEAFREKKGMPLKEKVRINLIADACIIYSLFQVNFLWVQCLIIALGLYKHYYFIFKIKTIKSTEVEME